MVSVTRSTNMEIEFFKKLSQDEARILLRQFLEVESSIIITTVNRCAADGIKMDFSIKSIAPFMQWVLKKLIAIPQKADPAVPEWIRNTNSYATRLFDFDERSEKLVRQAAYYLGESFVRSYSSLRWGTGDIRTFEANMPVVAGFSQHDMELAPILIAENLLRRVTAEPKKLGDFKKAVESWDQEV